MKVVKKSFERFGRQPGIGAQHFFTDAAKDSCRAGTGIYVPDVAQLELTGGDRERHQVFDCDGPIVLDLTERQCNRS
jgi:hypothetical protein